MFLISPDESTQKFAARKLEVARADVDALSGNSPPGE